MHLPLPALLSATRNLRGALAHPTSPSSTSLLQPRQDALAAPPPSSSIVIITSRITLTSSGTPTSNVNPKPTSDTHSFVSASMTLTETKTKTSSAARKSSFGNTSSQETFTTVFTSHDSPALTSSSTSTPPPTSSPAPPPTTGNRTALITGITLASLLALILLSLLIYWLRARTRGVNACNCFGSRSSRSMRSNQDKPLPERPAEVHDRPQTGYPKSRIRAAPRMGRASAGGGEGMRVQRRPDMGARRGLGTIPEF